MNIEKRVCILCRRTCSCLHIKNSKRCLLIIFLLQGLLFNVLQAQNWIHQGASPSKNGQVEGIADKEVAGAVNCVTPHPSNPDVIYIGAVNGGIWMTTNASSLTPVWNYISAGLNSHSIGEIVFDPSDTSHRTLIAGVGRYSSFDRQGVGGYGIFRTLTGGELWTNIDPQRKLWNRHINGIAARKEVIVVSSEDGIFRTVDTGARWERISGTISSGLPSGSSYVLAGPAEKVNVLYTNAGSAGIYKSIDTGKTWTKVSDGNIDAALSDLSNIKIAVGRNAVFVAIVNNRVLGKIFYSSNEGGTWEELDVPGTTEENDVFGIHPGAQGNIHLSLVADPTRDDLVYIGGDRQPAWTEPYNTTTAFPNSIGAQDYSGRLFMIDAAKPRGSQSTPLTHKGTANNSAPHADSRDMEFDASGNILEADDGGVYRRTTPRSSNGDWFSLNCNLNVSEVHSVDWDANANVVIGGLQDIGVPQQEIPSNVKWLSFSTGDGGDVCVDDISSQNISYRYSSANYLVNFCVSRWTSNNTFLDEVYPELYNLATTIPLPEDTLEEFTFVTPLKINSQNGSHILIATAKSLYESMDRGNTVHKVGDFSVNALGVDVLAYGASDNQSIIYAGAESTVYIRTQAWPNGFHVSTAYRGGDVQGISSDPDNCGTGTVIDGRNVYLTIDTGASWQNITGNLRQQNFGQLRSVAFISSATGTDFLAVGTEAGVFITKDLQSSQWERLGTNLPNVAVFDLEFDRFDRILLAGTLGMGVWTYQF